MTSAFPTDLVVRRVAGRIVAAWLGNAPDLEPWEVARTLGEVADEVRRPDLACDADSSETEATNKAVTSLLDELRAYCEHGPVPTPEAYEAACKALEKHRQRADTAEAEIERLQIQVKRKHAAWRLAARHATERDAEVREADQRVAEHEARIAQLEAAEIRQQLHFYDEVVAERDAALGEVERLRGEVEKLDGLYAQAVAHSDELQGVPEGGF